MAANNILQFAGSGTALVLSQAGYVAHAMRTAGHQPGVAQPDLENKALRQTSLLAAALAQVVADNQATDVGDDLTPAALATMIVNALRSLTAIPAGVSVWVPGTTPLPNTLEQNGALVGRAAYPRLWTFAQASGNIVGNDALWASGANYGAFSPGDGATTFRIPDLRGVAVRGWDHGRGLDAGRGIGTYQGDQNASHVHGVNDPAHAHAYIDPGHVHSSNITYSNESGSGNPWGSGGGANEGAYLFTIDGAGVGITIQTSLTGVTIQATGGSEVRTKTVALMPLIFY